jgi:PAS domain S-box-containing protein
MTGRAKARTILPGAAPTHHENARMSNQHDLPSDAARPASRPEAAAQVSQPLPEELRDLLAAALFDAHEAVAIVDTDLANLGIVFVNPAFTTLTGYAAEEVVGQTIRLLQGPKTDVSALAGVRAELAAGRSATAEVIAYHKDGSELWVEYRTAPIRAGAGRVSHYVSSLRDVTARRQSQEAAESSSLAKILFLSRISHELMTPLNSLIGFPEMLADGHFGPLNDRQLHAVGNVLEAAQQLHRLLQDLLDLARLESGRLQLDRSSFDLGTLLADLAGPVAEAARRKGLTLGVDVAGDLPRVCGDPVRLKQVALNLLDNAVKYTLSGGWVALRAWRAASPAGAPLVRLSVADSGIGIRRDAHERIFRMFEQVDPSLTRRQSGTGLGLALVTRILDLHDGRAWVESPGEGLGSTFHVELPGLREGEEGR